MLAAAAAVDCGLLPAHNIPPLAFFFLIPFHMSSLSLDKMASLLFTLPEECERSKKWELNEKGEEWTLVVSAHGTEMDIYSLGEEEGECNKFAAPAIDIFHLDLSASHCRPPTTTFFLLFLASSFPPLNKHSQLERRRGLV